MEYVQTALNSFEVGQIILFGIILLRVTIITMLLPFLGHNAIPVRIKISFAFLVSIIIYPLMAAHTTPHDMLWAISPLGLSLGLMQEVILGISIAIFAQLVFFAIHFAGQLISFSLGISMANVIDPVQSSHVAIIGQLITYSAIMLWIIVGGHHVMIYALFQSFTIFPPGPDFAAFSYRSIIDHGGELFVIGFQIAAPVILLLLFLYSSLGLVAKAVPRVQVFFVAMPGNLAFGFMMLAVSIPVILEVCNYYFGYSFTGLAAFFKIAPEALVPHNLLQPHLITPDLVD